MVSALVTEKDSTPGYNVSGLLAQDGKTVWVEKAEFDHYHVPMAQMPFGIALESLRRGCCIYRTSWPEGSYVHLYAGDGVRRPTHYISRSTLMRGRRTERLWSPSNQDMLACDWTVGTHQ